MGYVFDHVHLRSRDPEVAAQYYREVFGAIIHESIQLDGSRRFDVELGGMKLFIAPSDADSRDDEPPAVGIHHIGLRVADLERASAELEARGADFLEKPRVSRVRRGVKVAFVRAPEGVCIELLEVDEANDP